MLRHTILIALLFNVLGCFSKISKPGPDTGTTLALSAERLLQQYPIVRSQPLEQYHTELLSRLGTALPAAPRPGVRFRVRLVRMEQPFAFALPEGTIVVSTGLALRAESEASYAFVLAHEMGHLMLGHYDQDTADLRNLNLRPQLEDGADQYGLALVTRAGYDPRSAVLAVEELRFHVADTVATEGSTHPELLSRLQRMSSLIALSGWRPPGTTTTREHQRFLRLLGAGL